jgi:hypothetical protein
MKLKTSLLYPSLKVILLCSISFVFSPNKVLAQAEVETESEIFTSKNSVYSEFSGPIFNYSLNYGRLIYQKDRLKVAVSAGFSLRYRSRTAPVSSYWSPFIPLEVSAFWGKSKHHLGLGVGFFATRDRRYFFDEDFSNNIREESYWGKTLVPRIGYRYQKPAGGLFFRAAYTPTFSFDGDEDKVAFIPYGIGLSLGWSF